MYQQTLTVAYRDGTTEDVVVDQWSIGEYAIHNSRHGIKWDSKDPGLLAVAMMRYQAYAEKHRDVTGPRPRFEAWDRTVSEVVPADDETPIVDPTQPTISDESSATLP